MKIRTQFTLFIVAIIAIPLACVIVLPVYHYLSSPQQYLLKGYKEVRKMGELNVTEDDWDLLKEHLTKIPPHMQIIVYYDSKVLISTMPEIKAGTQLLPGELFDFIRQTSSTYDYQLQTPIAPYSENGVRVHGSHFKYLVVCRAKVLPSRPQRWQNIILLSVIVFFLFEAACITFIIILSKTIFSSIIILEEHTQKIANGELDTTFPLPHRHRQNEITSLIESLEKMRISLKDSEARRTKFIMGISHDLRTPVALIKGYTEALRDGVVTDVGAVKNSLSIIYTKSEQLESMINDLINYVKLNNTDWRQSLEAVQIAPLLEDFARSAISTGEIYKRTIQTTMDIPDDIKVPMDKNLFNRALENLFSNAIRYTKDGGTIRIEAHVREQHIAITIADTGIGIAPKDLEHIYDLFYRGTNSRREQGLGIGLSVVKTIIDTHGWHIDLDSQEEKGTCFTITIPLSQHSEKKTDV